MTEGSSQVVPYVSNRLMQGEVTVTRTELLNTITNTPTSSLLAPFNLPWLKTLAKVFERYRFKSIVLEYRPLVGAGSGGSTAVGFDWMQSSTSAEVSQSGVLQARATFDKPKILSMTPSFDTPVWGRLKSVVVPSSRLQSRAWYEVVDSITDASPVQDLAPGYIATLSTLANSGELWVTYVAQFSGTRS